jgi:hypothetical protein
VRLVRIRRAVTRSRQVALAAYRRHSAAGLCALALTQPMSYSASGGTLTGTAGAACRHRPSAVPFPSSTPSP